MQIIIFGLLSLLVINVVYFAVSIILVKKFKSIKYDFLGKQIELKVKEDARVNAFSVITGKILVTSASLNLPKDELDAMIAHEMGHIKLHHHLKMLILVNLLVLLFFYTAEFSLFLFIISGISIVLIQRFISRKFEIQADRYASQLVGKGSLMNLIMKYGENKSSIFSTHPPSSARIKKI
ncbi:peptidase M48, Ste24p [Acidianus hospitalis W1]|jgi:Zn-dependent protease with chaperone function|uniref:Peptidase M48, Ste24p n=1 Tax=Acidianus hospitalis (strain W1) TaxID=933801 RepID=F4B9N4_ACIHW|nr:M48 family metalloprotease [Acidianus hospitalis]AEE93950.1 peptidase M48, Ste24p [Acidianus hospitalis W1]